MNISELSKKLSAAGINANLTQSREDLGHGMYTEWEYELKASLGSIATLELECPEGFDIESVVDAFVAACNKLKGTS